MGGILICLFVGFMIMGHGCTGSPTADQFVPTPIPLSWGREFVEARQSRKIAEAFIPAHYWEDTLRHSVYLTLVRDRIDQLIGRTGKQIVPNQLDERDLWDRIKNAPFDRVEPVDPPAVDEATISSGRLLDEHDGYRFSENIKGTDTCSGEGCSKKISRALWSVKRVRHRDNEQSEGSYHYELTFYVVSDPQKKESNRARSFTVKESSAEVINSVPVEVMKNHDQPRLNKSVWFHKNIIHPEDEWAAFSSRNFEPEKSKVAGETYGETARMFTGIFDDDDEDLRKPKRIPSNWGQPQYAKIKVPVDFNQQKKLSPYPYKSHGKYNRPPVTVAGNQHHYLDFDAIGVVSNPYLPQDNKVAPSKSKLSIANATYVPKVVQAQNIKQVHNPIVPQKQSAPTFLNPLPNRTSTSNLNPPREALSYAYKEKPIAIKYTYVKQGVRPPVHGPLQAPHVEKKPFKPMPPIAPTKHQHLPKPTKPINFKPSLQLLDIHFSEPDPLDDSFRPMRVNFNFTNNTMPESELTDIKNIENTPKELETITEATTEPEIITIDPEKLRKQRKTTTTTTTTTTSTTTAAPPTTTEELTTTEDLSWTNLLGAFADSAKATQFTTTEADEPTTTEDIYREIVTEQIEPSSIEPKPTTRAASSTSTTTPKPTRPKRKTKKRLTSTTPKEDRDEVLVTEASIAGAYKRNEFVDSTRSTLHISRGTTVAKTTTPAPEDDKKEVHDKKEDPLKTINRYRQSAVMTKGTSIKHDKWSSLVVPEPTKILPKPAALVATKTRRTESNFQGYNTAPTLTHSYEVVENISEEPTTTYKVIINNDSRVVDSDISASNPNESVKKQKEYTRSKFENTSKFRPNVFSLKALRPKQETEAKNETEEVTTTTTVPKVTIKKVCKKKKTTTTTSTTTSTEKSTTPQETEESYQEEEYEDVNEDASSSAENEDTPEIENKTKTDESSQYEHKENDSIDIDEESDASDNVEVATLDKNSTRPISFLDFLTQDLELGLDENSRSNYETTVASIEEPLYGDFGESSFLELMSME